MRFFEYSTIFNIMKKQGYVDKNEDISKFYVKVEQLALRHNQVFSYRQAQLEKNWLDTKRPYYNIWPAIYPMMEKLALDIPCSSVTMPEGLPVLCLRLSEENNPLTWENETGPKKIKTIIFGEQEVNDGISGELTRGLVIGADFGEVDANGGSVLTFKIFPLVDGYSIEEMSDKLPYHESWDKGIKVPMEIIHGLIRLSICVCLIGSDDELITPDILSKDRQKLDGADDELKDKLVDRAVRRGKFGFDLGAKVDKIPHYRRPHLAKVWIGKGRKDLKVVLRKGSVVHRESIVKVPSGYSG